MGHFLSYASVALLTAFRCGGGREVSSMQSDADFLYILSGKDGLGWLGGNAIEQTIDEDNKSAYGYVPPRLCG